MYKAIRSFPRDESGLSRNTIMIYVGRFLVVCMFLTMPWSTSLATQPQAKYEERIKKLEDKVDKISRDLTDISAKLDKISDSAPPPSDGGTPPPSEGGSPLVLTNSGPVSASVDGEVIENLRITADCQGGSNGISVDGHINVTIRNVEIHHSCRHGIQSNFAHGLVIQDVRIIRTDVPSSGPAETIGNNIHILNSDHVRITRAQLWRGSSGMWSIDSFDLQMRFIEGHDFRGPYPRGQLAQFGRSDSCLLEDFSVENPLIHLGQRTM